MCVSSSLHPAVLYIPKAILFWIEAMLKRHKVLGDVELGQCDVCAASSLRPKEEFVVKVMDRRTNKRQWRCSGHVRELDPETADLLERKNKEIMGQQYR